MRPVVVSNRLMYLGLLSCVSPNTRAQLHDTWYTAAARLAHFLLAPYDRNTSMLDVTIRTGPSRENAKLRVRGQIRARSIDLSLDMASNSASELPQAKRRRAAQRNTAVVKKDKRPNTAAIYCYCWCCQQYIGQATLSQHLQLKFQAIPSGLVCTSTRWYLLSFVSRVAMIAYFSADAACCRAIRAIASRRDEIPPHFPVFPVPRIQMLRFPIFRPLSTNRCFRCT